MTFGTANALATTISASVDGTYTIRFTVIDAEGNISYDEMTLIWDTTAPVTTASPSGGNYSSYQNVNLSANEPANIYYTTNGSNPSELSSLYSEPITISTTTTLKFFAKDTAGNVELVKMQEYTICLNDIPGDLNSDGAVTLADAIIALQILVGLQIDNTICQFAVKGDGKIGMQDVIYILQTVAGIR